MFGNLTINNLETLNKLINGWNIKDKDVRDYKSGWTFYLVKIIKIISDQLPKNKYYRI